MPSKGTSRPFTNRAECTIPYTQRIGVPQNVDSRGGYICCGGVEPKTGRYYREKTCFGSGWQPDMRQRRIHRAWNDIHAEEKASNNTLSLPSEITDGGVTCPAGRKPYRVNILGQDRYVCYNISQPASSIYNTSVGNLEETVVFSNPSCTTSSCESPFNSYVGKPEGYEAKYELGESAGCGVCPSKQKCVLGLCRNVAAEEDTPESTTVFYSVNGLSNFMIFVIIIVSILFLAMIIIGAYMYMKPTPVTEGNTTVQELPSPVATSTNNDVKI